MQSRSMFGRVFVAHGSEQVKKKTVYMNMEDYQC